MTAKGTPGKRSFSHALAFGGLSFGSNVLLGIITSIAIARVYGITVIGEYALVIAPTTAMWFLSSLGERTALQRELGPLPIRDRRITGLIVAVLTFSFAFTLVIGAAVLTLVYYLYAGPIDQPQLFLPALVNMLGYLIAANSSWTLDTVLNAARAGRELFRIKLGFQITYLVLAIGIGLFWGTVWALVIATVVPAFTNLVRRVWVLRRYMVFRVTGGEIRDGFRALPPMIRFGLKLTPGGITNGLSNESAIWILGVTSPIAAVGAYSRAWMLGQRFRELNRKINEVLLPTLVERRAQGDGKGFDRASIDSARYVVILTTLVAAIGGGAAYGVMELYGPGFSQAAPALAILLLMPPVIAIVQVQSQVLLAHDRPGLLSNVMVGRALLGIPLSLGLILVGGITGAAAGVVVGDVGSAVCLAVFTRRYFSEPVSRLWPPRQVVALVGAYLVAFAASLGLDQAIPTPLGLIAALAGGTVVFVSCLVAFGGLGPRDRRRFVALMRRLRTRRAGAAPAAAGTGGPEGL